ncbi:hypothetical protein M1513_01345 [Patescibacteria group bacterium]|nr:hypothetical protein [Patescibacteria group bacterium]MCL5733054.1 hypothetical protein [Patescibacteria group bacterium]
MEKFKNNNEEVSQRLPDKEAQELIAEKIDVSEIEKKLEGKAPFSGTVETLARLVVELGDKIPKYDTIISDDASARLVSLLMRKIINIKKEEAGEKPVETYFIAGGRHDDNPEVYEYINKFIESKKDNLKNTLLVTEYIYFGEGMLNLVRILEQNKIKFDIAAVSTQVTPRIYDRRISKHLYYGEAGGREAENLKGPDNFYNKENISGVKKVNAAPDIIHPVVYLDADKEKMKEARNDIDFLAGEFAKLV